VTVAGLGSARVQDAADLERLLETAARARSTASTQCNAHSSRSHYVFRLSISGSNQTSGHASIGELNLVDLAGSERVKDSGVSGAEMKEAQCINKSLSALGDVITAMSTKARHVPYRNSKLSHLLQNALSGSSKMLMFVNVSPQERHLQETLSSLRFASKAASCQAGPVSRHVAKKA